MKDFFKNFLKNFKSYGFWVSLCGAIIILVNALGRAFGFSIENQIVEDCIMSFAGVLVVLGIVTKNPKKDNLEESDDENSENQIQQNVEKENKKEDEISSEDKKDLSQK